MPTTVGALQVDLQANTASFIADMGRAAQAISSNTAQMKIALDGVSRALDVVKSGAALLGVGLGVEKLIEFTKESASAKAELQSLSVQLGVSTDALQGYRFAAAQNGIAAAELDTGINHLSRTIGEAVKGNTDAIETFRELKVGLLAAGQVRSTEEIFLDVATAIAKIEDSSKRTRLEVAAFGRDGARFGALIAAGGPGLNEFTAKARELGIVVDKEVIHTLDDAANRSAVFQLRMQAAAANVAARFFEMSQSVRDSLQAMYDKLRERAGVPDGPAFSGPIPPAPLPGPPPPRPSLPEGFTLPQSDADKRRDLDVRKRIEDINQEAASLGKLKSEILAVQLSRELDAEASVKQGKDVRRYTDEQVAAIVAAQQKLEAKQSVEEDINADRGRRDATLQFRQEQERLTAQTIEQAKAASASRVEWDNVSKSYRVNSDELAIVTKQQEILNQRLDLAPEEARKMAEAYVAASEKLRSASAAAETDLRRINAAIGEVDGFTERVFDHIGQGFTTAFAQGETAADRFKAVVSSVVTEVTGELFKLTLVNPLKNELFGSNSPTISDVGGLLGGLGKRGTKSAGASNDNAGPEELGLTLPGAEDQCSQNIVSALSDQTAKTGDFFSTLGDGVTSGLQGLGGFLNQGLMLIVTTLEGLAGSSAAGGGGGGGILGALGGLFGGGAAAEGESAGVEELGLTLVEAAADGSESTIGGPTLVGEEGPEIVDMPKGARVIPNDATSALLAGNDNGGPTIYADLRGADVGAVQRLENFVASMNGSIERRAVGANVDAVRRGGPARRSYAAIAGAR